jgi:hypothetical protein
MEQMKKEHVVCMIGPPERVRIMEIARRFAESMWSSENITEEKLSKKNFLKPPKRPVKNCKKEGC